MFKIAKDIFKFSFKRIAEHYRIHKKQEIISTEIVTVLPGKN